MTEPTTPMDPFHMDIHKWVTEHSPQHDDYAQYHQYCTKKLHRLAHQKDAKKYLIHSNKFVTVKSAGTDTGGGKPKRHAYCSRRGDTFAAVSNKNSDNSDDNVTADQETGQEEPSSLSSSVAVPHVNILWYLLVNSERSWANANEVLKSKGKRQTVLKKLKRAKHWADQLRIMATSTSDDTGLSEGADQIRQPTIVDTTTMKEIEAYCAWMSANLAVEKGDFMTAGQEFAKAMTVCYELSETSVDNEPDTQRLERQDLFLSRADQILRPLFRYCQYELKQAGASPVAEPKRPSVVGSNESDSINNDTSEEDTIVFRDTPLILDSKELRVLLLKLQSMEQEQKSQDDGNTSESQFLGMLSVLDDALEVVQTLQKNLSTVATSGPAVQAKVRQYSLWKGYLEYSKTKKVMVHTEGLLVSAGKDRMDHAGQVHIYDALIQHAKSLLSLPRPDMNDSNEDDEFELQAQANVLRLRTLKTFSMAFVYYENHKYTHALALLNHAAELCKRAEEEIAACDDDGDMPTDEYLQQLEELPISSSINAVRAAIVLQQRQHIRRMARAGADPSMTGQEPMATDRPLLLRLYDLDGGTPNAPIADLRPIPMPCKPVFYDLAYNHALDPTESADKISSFIYQHTVQPDDEGKDEADGTTSSSFFGWLTGSGS